VRAPLCYRDIHAAFKRAKLNMNMTTSRDVDKFTQFFITYVNTLAILSAKYVTPMPTRQARHCGRQWQSLRRTEICLG
jgi:hypothetical protein